MLLTAERESVNSKAYQSKERDRVNSKAKIARDSIRNSVNFLKESVNARKENYFTPEIGKSKAIDLEPTYVLSEEYDSTPKHINS